MISGDNKLIPWSVIINVLNKTLTFNMIIEHYTGEEYKYNLKNNSSIQIFCPFHDNTKTKAATLYKNEEGIETIWCFAESRKFKPYDMLKIYADNKEIYYIFKRIWNQLSDEEKSKLSIVDDNSYLVEFDDNTNNLFIKLDDIKTNKKGYKDALQDFVSFLKKD